MKTLNTISALNLLGNRCQLTRLNPVVELGEAKHMMIEPNNDSSGFEVVDSDSGTIYP
jgi:hypothetical protein